jgi:hypothetical protein
MRRIFIKKCFLFTVGSVCRVKRFHLGSKLFADDEEVEKEVRKWLRQQTKDFYAAGFDTRAKRRDKCISVGREISAFLLQVRISHVLRFISICDLSTDRRAAP